MARKLAIMKWLERLKKSGELLSASLKLNEKTWGMLSNASMSGILPLAELVSLEDALGKQGEGYHEVYAAVFVRLKEIGWI